MVEASQIKSLSEAIAREFQPHRIFLFGSYAYGQPNENSDVDLLIVMPLDVKPSRKALEILNKIRPDFPVDLLVRTPEQVESRAANNDWFMLEILHKGNKLYESNYA